MAAARGKRHRHNAARISGRGWGVALTKPGMKEVASLYEAGLFAALRHTNALLHETPPLLLQQSLPLPLPVPCSCPCRCILLLRLPLHPQSYLYPPLNPWALLLCLFPNSQISKFPNFQISNFQFSNFQNSKFSKFSNLSNL